MRALLLQPDSAESDVHRRRLLAESDQLLERVEHLRLMEQREVPQALSRSIRSLQLRLGWTGATEARTLRAASSQLFSVQQRLMSANPRAAQPRAHLGRPPGVARTSRVPGAGVWKFLSLPALAPRRPDGKWCELVGLTVERALDRWCWAQGQAIVHARRERADTAAALGRAHAAWANYWELRCEADRLLDRPQ